MDNSKVNGLSVLYQARPIDAQPLRASEVATDRFARWMVDGTRVSNLTREAPQENREVPYRRWQTPVGGLMGDIARDVASGPVKEQIRGRIDPAEVAISNSVWSQFATPMQSRETTAARGAPTDDLTQMLERMCSALYVGDKSVDTQRLVMALDHVLPGAAAEIVREGVHLSIRLHARTEESYRSMSSQRDALIRALSSDGDRRVDVSVVHGDEQGLGERHG